jgi:hypothetical protein
MRKPSTGQMSLPHSNSIADWSGANSPNERRLLTICLSLLISIASLVAAVAAHERGLRLASNPTVIATVKNILIGRGGTSGEYAHLIYDRKDQNGQLIHCDLPRVRIGNFARKLTNGDPVTIAPRANSCWEPDIICEICASSKESVEVLSAVSAASGVLFAALIWRGRRVSEGKISDERQSS